MLSVTYEIVDIKRDLENGDFYGYSLTTILGDLTSGSAVITNLTDTSDLAIGQTVSGDGIQDESLIVSIDSGTEITISKIATSTAAGSSIYFDINFVGRLDDAIEAAVYETMYLKIGETYYTTLAAKDKTGLTTTETYIYKAEVEFAKAEYVGMLARQDKYNRKAYRETVSQDGVSRSTSGTIGKELMGADFIEKGWKYLALAGVNISDKMGRGNSVHYDGSSFLNTVDYP